MSISIIPQDAPSGATIRDVDLSAPVDPETIAEIRAAWLEHQVLAFPDQPLAIEDIERFVLGIGRFGEDPFFESIPGHPHVAQVRRDADERTPIFAESWHSDWSFLPSPPIGTVLHGSVIPPIGGDTLFANQYAAWDALSADMKTRLGELRGIHSARRGYAPDGMYGKRDTGRSMAIRYSEEAMKTQTHPIARVHPETGRTALFVNPGYTIGIEDMPDDEAQDLLMELFRHQGQESFVYRHRWSTDMLLLWDNRCLLHSATGGYDGHDRLLHRITVAG
jgi:taurine dioxygenase